MSRGALYFKTNMALSSEDLLVLLALYRRRGKVMSKYTKRFWVTKIFAIRKEKGEFNNLVREMRLHDQEFFIKMFRMSLIQLEELTRLVAPLIRKESSRREAIVPQESVYQFRKLWVNTILIMRMCVINCILIGRDFFSASEIRKKLNSIQLFWEEKFFAENWRNVNVHEQNIFREKFFSFRKAFSQWRSGFT